MIIKFKENGRKKTSNDDVRVQWGGCATLESLTKEEVQQAILNASSTQIQTSNHLVIHFEGWAVDPRNMPEATVVVNDGFTLFRNTNTLLSANPDFWHMYLPWIDRAEANRPSFPTEFYNDRRCCIYVFDWNSDIRVNCYLLPSKIDINLSDFSFNIYGSNDTNLSTDYSNQIILYGTIPEESRAGVLSLISIYSISCTRTVNHNTPVLQSIWTELYNA